MACSSTPKTTTTIKIHAKIALIGAGWWSQGWHLPHLKRNPKSQIVAILDTNPNPKSNLNPNLVSLSTLSSMYDDVPTFTSMDDMMESNVFQKDDDGGCGVDGVIICTPHATHMKLAKMLIERYPSLHILLEKPMTTCPLDAKELHDIVSKRDAAYMTNNSSTQPKPAFLLNHSANYRTQTIIAKSTIQNNNKIGPIRHITASFASPLSWIFSDPSNTGWNEPNSTMIGNGFAWGQSSHLLAWIYHVTSVRPVKVYCIMNHCPVTGADVCHSASITCEDGITMSVSGTTNLPGNAHSDPPVGKLVDVQIYGTKGALLYRGDDRDVNSGRLELRHEDGKVEDLCPNLGFEFENIDDGGIGPESLQAFLEACCGSEDYYVGADVELGLCTILTIDAMYRSYKAGNVVDVRF